MTCLATRCIVPPLPKRGKADHVDVGTEYLTGAATWSEDITLAKRFETSDEAHEALDSVRYWYAVRTENDGTKEDTP